MIDEDAPDEGGLEPADEPNEPPVEEDDAVEAEAAPEETYTRQQLAELLGPRFERFASHEGEEAFRQYGQAYESATGLIRQGAHLEPQDPSVYERIGLDAAEVPQPAQEEPQGLWGTPWQEPTTWEEVQAYANTDDPGARRLAAMAVLRDPNAPDDIKNAYFNHWAQLDPAGATLYSQQALVSQQQQIADQIREELRAEMQAQYGPVQQQHVTETIDAMIARASAEIPGFVEHKQGIVTLMQEREQRYPGYTERFNNASLDERVAELDELTTIAAKRFAPQRKAAQKKTVEDTDAAIRASQSETGRSNGAPETEQQAMKRRSLEDARRVGGRVY
jgi:hypothetical protein